MNFVEYCNDYNEQSGLWVITELMVLQLKGAQTVETSWVVSPFSNVYLQRRLKPILYIPVDHSAEDTAEEHKPQLQVYWKDNCWLFASRFEI